LQSQVEGNLASCSAASNRSEARIARPSRRQQHLQDQSARPHRDVPIRRSFRVYPPETLDFVLAVQHDLALRLPDRSGVRAVFRTVAGAGRNVDGASIEVVLGPFGEQEEKLIIPRRSVLCGFGHRVSFRLLRLQPYEGLRPDYGPTTNPLRPAAGVDEAAKLRIRHGEVETKRHSHLRLVADARHVVLEKLRLLTQGFGVASPPGGKATVRTVWRVRRAFLALLVIERVG